MFRHQQNASMNKKTSHNENSNNATTQDEGTSSRQPLRGFYSYKNSFDEDSVWLDLPKNGTRVFPQEAVFGFHGVDLVNSHLRGQCRPSC